MLDALTDHTTMHTMPTLRTLALLLSSSLLVACEGAVNVDLSATPPEGVSAAIVRIDTVRFLSDDGNNRDVQLADDFQVDLNNLGRGGVQSLLREEDVGAGNYSGIELLLSADSDTLDSYISDSNGDTSLILRAGRKVQANTAFSINEEDNTSLTLHFDLRSSLLLNATANGDREIAARLRLVKTGDSGTLSGNVATALLQQQGCDEDNDPSRGEVAYIFRGNAVNVDELDGVNAEPLTTALVSRDAAAADYVAAFLPAGDYTVAITCNADLDDPLRTDGIGFIANDTASVSAGSVTTLNFTKVQ